MAALRARAVRGALPAGLGDLLSSVEEGLAADERQGESGASVLSGAAFAWPGVSRAVELGRCAATVGFDWTAIEGVRGKVAEELAELDEAMTADDRDAIVHEMGDLLFALANLCRHLRLDPEDCLHAANARFATRFGRVERKVRSGRGEWSAYGPRALEELWRQAKSET